MLSPGVPLWVKSGFEKGQINQKEDFYMLKALENIKLKDFFSVPNLITYLRFALIPAIIWAYCTLENGILTVVFVAISALTDVLDGKIARRFNQVTDIGKALDPVADKLTQAAMMYCLLSKYELMLPVLIILIVKEIFMVATALWETKATSEINGALWYGKACTVFLYAVMLVLMFFPKIPLTIANVMIILSAVAMIVSTVLYGIHRFKRIIESSKSKAIHKKQN